MSYKKALQQFLTLPDNQQRFAEGEYYSNDYECSCALGTLIPELKIIDNRLQSNTIESLAAIDSTSVAVAKRLEDLDLTLSEATLLQKANDNPMCEPEERYKEVITFLQEQVGKEVSEEIRYESLRQQLNATEA